MFFNLKQKKKKKKNQEGKEREGREGERHEEQALSEGSCWLIDGCPRPCCRHYVIKKKGRNVAITNLCFFFDVTFMRISPTCPSFFPFHPRPPPPGPLAQMKSNFSNGPTLRHVASFHIIHEYSPHL